jgi:hypothetical protein
MLGLTLNLLLRGIADRVMEGNLRERTAVATLVTTLKSPIKPMAGLLQTMTQ